MDFTSLEICAGGGGQAIGLEAAGFDPVVTEKEFPDAFEMLRSLVEGKRLKDIADLPLDLCV
jgi:site-specific DNA-cytosine methylase